MEEVGKVGVDRQQKKGRSLLEGHADHVSDSCDSHSDNSLWETTNRDGQQNSRC